MKRFHCYTHNVLFCFVENAVFEFYCVPLKTKIITFIKIKNMYEQ